MVDPSAYTLPDTIKQKMWLCHYQPNPKQDSLKDNFLGFVSKGQIFEISARAEEQPELKSA